MIENLDDPESEGRRHSDGYERRQRATPDTTREDTHEIGRDDMKVLSATAPWLRGTVLTVTAVLSLACGARAGESTGAEDELVLGIGDEGLLFEDIPSVVSASLFEERLLTAPSSVVMATGEEIRRSGARDLVDAVRWLPGIDVFS